MLQQPHSWGTLTSSGELGSSPEPLNWTPSQQLREQQPRSRRLHCKPSWASGTAWVTLSYNCYFVFNILIKVITFLPMLFLVVYLWSSDVGWYFFSFWLRKCWKKNRLYPAPCSHLFLSVIQDDMVMCLDSIVFQMIADSQRLTLFSLGETEPLRSLMLSPSTEPSDSTSWLQPQQGCACKLAH